MGKTLTIYPFSSQSICLIDLINQTYKDVCSIHLVSPIGLGLGEKDAGYADNRYVTGHIVETDVIDAINQSDTLIITDGSLHDSIHVNTVSAIQYALRNKKRVVSYLPIDDLLKAKLMEISLQYGSELVLEADTYTDFDYSITSFKKEDYGIYNHCPIIVVGGLLEENNILEVFLKLVCAIKKKGLKVSSFSLSNYISLVKGHSLKPLLHTVTFNEAKKIEMIENYIGFIEQAERPDIIVIQAPDPIIRFSETIPNGYGILSYMLAQAIQPDLFTCCAHSYMGDLVEFLNSISEDTTIRLGFGIDYAHISNTVLDNNALMEEKTITTTKIDMEYIDSSIKEIKPLGISIYNLINPSDFNMFVSDVVERINEV